MDIYGEEHTEDGGSDYSDDYEDDLRYAADEDIDYEVRRDRDARQTEKEIRMGIQQTLGAYFKPAHREQQTASNDGQTPAYDGHQQKQGKSQTTFAWNIRAAEFVPAGTRDSYGEQYDDCTQQRQGLDGQRASHSTSAAQGCSTDAANGTNGTDTAQDAPRTRTPNCPDGAPQGIDCTVAGVGSRTFERAGEAYDGFTISSQGEHSLGGQLVFEAEGTYGRGRGRTREKRGTDGRRHTSAWRAGARAGRRYADHLATRVGIRAHTHTHAHCTGHSQTTTREQTGTLRRPAGEPLPWYAAGTIGSRMDNIRLSDGKFRTPDRPRRLRRVWWRPPPLRDKQMVTYVVK